MNRSSVAQQIVDLARAQSKAITTAESCTGGMVAAAITDVAGASAIFERGFVTYSNDAKSEMLDVRADTLRTHGAVSEAVVTEMARGARIKARADVAVAVSGIAGPGGSDHKPEGRVCYAISTATQTICETVDHGALGRENVRQVATKHALMLILTALDATALP